MECIILELFTPVEFRDEEWRPHYKSKAYPMWSYYRNHENRLTSQKRRYHGGYKIKCHEYYEENKEHKLQLSKEWDLAHPGYRSEYMKTRRKEYPGKVKSEERIKDKERKQRLINKDLLPEIEQYYSLCLEGYEIDHIIPIKGKLVSGLHVPWNLQYLTKDENNFKRAKFDGTYENNSWKIKYQNKRNI